MTDWELQAAIDAGASFTVCAPQRAPRQRMRVRSGGHSWQALATMVEQSKIKAKNHRFNRPALIGTYVRKDSGPCKLVPIR